MDALLGKSETIPAAKRETSQSSVQPDESGRHAPAHNIAALYERHSSVLMAALRKEFGDGPPDPNDVVHEAFTRLSEQRDLSAIKNLRAFVWRIARNLMLTQKRNTRVRSQFDFEVEHLFFASGDFNLTPERVLEVRQQLEIIDATLRTMPVRNRKAFLWHRIDKLNYAAIAKRLGVSGPTAAKAVSDAMLQIDVALFGAGEAEEQ